MRLRLGIPGDLSRPEMAAALNAALEASTASSAPRIARRKIPTFEQALAKGGIRWAPEPPGDEHFDSPRTVIVRGWGDCDDLAPWHAASLRATGEDPDARAIVRPSGPKRWHAIVERGDGALEDPSRAAGMGSRVSGQLPAAWAPMWNDRLALAAHPWRGGWAGRVDLPDRALPAAWSAVHAASSPAAAVVGAIRGARHVAALCGTVDGVDEIRLAGLEGLLCGVHPEQVEAELDEYGAVGFLPFLAPAAMSLAAPLLKKVLPGGGGGGGGGGAPAASSPSAAAGQHPHAGPGTTMTCPGGPIIVRF